MSPNIPVDNSDPISAFIRRPQGQLTHAELSDSYKFAFNDREFLSRPETIGVRFQLELLKPELVLKDHSIRHTIVVFGSARCKSAQESEKQLKEAKTPEEIKLAKKAVEDSLRYESARKFGALVATYNLKQGINEHKLRICTGGGPGIMEAATRGAAEEGDLTIGLNISLPHEQAPNPYITPELCFRFHYFAIRKMHFMIRARAIVVYPGGFGSFDELFEILTLIQTKKINPLPVVLVDRKFWEKALNFPFLVEEGYVDEADLNLFQFAETAQDVWKVISGWYHLI